MALALAQTFSHVLIFIGSLSIFLMTPSSCINPRKLLNGTSNSSIDLDFLSSLVGFYGPPNGDGSEGGACNYGNVVGLPPFNSMVSAGSPAIFQSGKGCGTCYQVKCTGNPACSDNPVTVVITDECLGCNNFDMSGKAFGAMAVSGQADNLRNAGKVAIEYTRVLCNYPGVPITFRVDAGSNQDFFAILVEYEDGDGDLKTVELKEAPSSATYQSMQRSFGAVWKLNKRTPLIAPFSLRLTQIESGKVYEAKNVIPVGWRPGQTFRAIGNFN